ncbi:MAG: GNAT family N-acetyltransferase [Actinomycetes bacterium]
MRALPLGLATDLAVLELTGSTIEDRGDHLVVGSAHNPDFHWGNAVFVTDEHAVADAERWVGTFQVAFPTAPYVAVGLVRMPEDTDGWAAQGVSIELDDVLSARTTPHQTPLPSGYAVRPFEGADWDQSLERAVAQVTRTGEEDPRSYRRFAGAEMRARRALCERGEAAFFGTYADDGLVAELGIVRCGTTARYQAVATDDAHRRRGLASHLLGVAAQWAGERGCDRWVIVTEATNPAGRVYRRAGFQPDTGIAQAYRRPVR